MAMTYSFTDRLWPEEGVIDVLALNNTRIISVSVQFLRIGHVLSWEYVTQAIAACIQEQEFQLYHRRSDTGLLTPVDTSSTPTACNVYCRLKDAAAPHFQVGPRFHYLRRGPDEDDTATMSHSSRSTVRQAGFRTKLIRRDAYCLVSDFEDAVAAHILPQSRPEYYTEALGRDPGDLFDVSFGLLLNRTLHSSFDRGEWALFPDSANPDDLIVHVFKGVDQSHWHGVSIPRTRFRYKRIAELPDRRLLRFHYQQCMMKHLRGFSFFPPPPDIDNA